ncbi:MAG: DUF2461 domain-containing protein [Bacteroides sp.]|nr:DUF2461 domain-containing protein [Bacteroides sp.]
MSNLIFDFLRELKQNNTREWMAEHTEEYKAVRKLRDETAQLFIDTVASVDPAATGYPLEQSTYRIARDTRFSDDKSPYKTHIGIFVCPPLGKKSLLSGYYLHLEPGKSSLWGGNYCLPNRYLTAIRKDIRDNIDEYISIIESPEFKKFFPSVGFDLLKTAPKGFLRDWEYINYVRPREFAVDYALDDKFFDKKDYMKRLVPILEQVKRLNDFYNFTLTESGLPLMREERIRN